MSSPLVVLAPAREGAAPYLEWDPARDPSPLLPDATWLRLELHRATVNTQLLALSANGCDVAINLCDGALDEDQPGVDVVRALERMGLAFTGAGSRSYDPSREAMKMAAWSCEVAVPAFARLVPGEPLTRALDQLRFPMLVKHPHGYNSVGMPRQSRVTTPTELAEQVLRMTTSYGGALVEEFIEGREFTVLVEEGLPGSDPRVSQPAEVGFPPGETWKHFDLKWMDHARLSQRPVEDMELAWRLATAAAQTFTALQSEGYARLDLRTDAEGRVHFLESNPNPAVFYPPGAYGLVDHILAQEPGGHVAFLERQLSLARARRDRDRPAWRLEFDRLAGFGLCAARNLTTGETVLSGEEQPLVAVSRAHAENTWTGVKRTWLDTYAWPLSDELFAMWDGDPERWRPVNHSCDPNMWLVGLDTVTRRPVRAGDALTMDYATFCGPNMAPFDCHCGAQTCRRRVHPEDVFRADLLTRYEGHLSAHAKARTDGRRS